MADDIDFSQTRALSCALFGGAHYRLEVGAAIAESDGSVCMVDLVQELCDPPGKSSVNAELKVLERAKLLSRRKSKSDRRIHLVREESSYWEMCLDLRDKTAKPRKHRGRSPQ